MASSLEPVMAESQLVPFDRVFWELRYQPSFLFQDHVGGIAHACQAIFPTVTATAEGHIVALDSQEEARIRVSPVHAWLSHLGAAPLDSFFQWARPVVDRVVSELLEVTTLIRVGLRSYAVLRLETTEVATELFKKIVCDYYGPPLNALPGKPVAVGFELRNQGWHEHGGARLDCRLAVTPIQFPGPESRPNLEVDENLQGALLLDLDAYLADDQTVGLGEAVEDLTQSLVGWSLESVKALTDAFLEGGDEVRKRA